MKTYKVKEEYLVTCWTFIKAESLEQAEEFLEDDEYYGIQEEIDSKHEKTYWETLQEVIK